MAEFLKQYEIFFKKANTDLKAAQFLFEKFENGDTELDLEIICFHLQQSAEKYLKAILSKNKIEFSRVHDLETLINLIEKESISTNFNRQDLIDLTDFAVEGRYSVILDDINDTGKYFKAVEKLKAETQKLIPHSKED